MYQWSNRQTYPIIISLQQSPWHALNSEHALTHHSNPYKVSCLRLFSDLMECSESMKACLYSTSMFCKREYQIGIKIKPNVWHPYTSEQLKEIHNHPRPTNLMCLPFGTIRTICKLRLNNRTRKNRNKKVGKQHEVG